MRGCFYYIVMNIREITIYRFIHTKSIILITDNQPFIIRYNIFHFACKNNGAYSG